MLAQQDTENKMSLEKGKMPEREGNYPTYQNIHPASQDHFKELLKQIMGNKWVYAFALRNNPGNQRGG